MNKERKKNALERWAEKPLVPGACRLLFYLCVAMAGCFLWTRWQMDNDSYYMIPQGLDILENGIPKYNTVFYHENLKIVVQQWLYCVAMALTNKLLGNFGLMLFMILQAMAVVWIAERFLKKATRDPFWSHLAAALTILVCSAGYTFTMRPENVTMFCMFAQCMCLDRYRNTKKKSALLPLPIIMLAEANLHISMWPVHLCIYLAYFVPAAFPWIQKQLQEKGMLKKDLVPGILEADGLKPEPYLYGMSILSILAVFINPYGLDGFLYLFNSMPVFQLVSITEQMPPFLISELGIIDMMLVAAFLWLLFSKRLKATESLLSAGFIFLACMNYHNSIFLPLAMASLSRAALRMLESKKPSLAKEIMPNGVKAVLYAGVAAGIVVTVTMTLPVLEDYKGKDDLDVAIEFLKENQSENGNILNNMNTGPMLEHAGIKGIFGDTRPELLTAKIGGSYEFAEEITWFANGYMMDGVLERYDDIGQYLDDNDIQFVVDITRAPNMAYLWGWLDNSTEWVLHDFAEEYESDDHDSSFPYGIYERIGFDEWYREKHE